MCQMGKNLRHGDGGLGEVVVAAVTRMKQDRYLRMVAPPGCRLGSV